ncbi:MAG TPA: TIGR01777 family oxidoreductase [Ignavibacteria bacterium]|nr:TIGR01777 family oxidoreductase [Ignavibacteria bacterium]HMR39616.1 TIGR01777 family oxidoreductase [Ignavibacteria bacterium]
MEKKILLTGATGMIGSKLVKELVKQGALVRILTTNPDKAAVIFKNEYTKEIFNWANYDDPAILYKLLEDTDAVVNLAGANVAGKRWSEDYKKVIYDSRVDNTKLIVDALGYCENTPECLINASGVGYYGFSGDGILKEDSPPGNDFLARVCRDWENEALKAAESGIRVVNIRTGIVLDKNEGAIKEMIAPLKFKIGVYQGNGKQWFSWIHLDDIVQMYIFAIQNTKISGALNGCSPHPVSNRKFIETMAGIMDVKLILPVPEFMLKIAVGEFAKNLCTGQRVEPEVALKEDFGFKFPELKPALENILKS